MYISPNTSTYWSDSKLLTNDWSENEKQSEDVRCFASAEVVEAQDTSTVLHLTVVSIQLIKSWHARRLCRHDGQKHIGLCNDDDDGDAAAAAAAADDDDDDDDDYDEAALHHSISLHIISGAETSKNRRHPTINCINPLNAQNVSNSSRPTSS